MIFVPRSRRLENVPLMFIFYHRVLEVFDVIVYLFHDIISMTIEIVETFFHPCLESRIFKDRYGGKASLYVESKDNPEMPFPIPFINYGNVDVDKLKKNCTELDT